MVANIRSGATPGGTLYYNKEKVDRDEAEILYWQKMPNPSPEDKLTDGQLREIACEYMERMSALTDDGYGVGTPFKSSRIGKDIGYKAFKVLRDVERQTERTGSARPTATNSQRCHEPA